MELCGLSTISYWPTPQLPHHPPRKIICSEYSVCSPVASTCAAWSQTIQAYVLYWPCRYINLSNRDRSSVMLIRHFPNLRFQVNSSLLVLNSYVIKSYSTSRSLTKRLGLPNRKAGWLQAPTFIFFVGFVMESKANVSAHLVYPVTFSLPDISHILIVSVVP